MGKAQAARRQQGAPVLATPGALTDALLRTLTGDIPPLDAYPAAQRGRIETDLNALDAKSGDGDTGSTLAGAARALDQAS